MDPVATLQRARDALTTSDYGDAVRALWAYGDWVDRGGAHSPATDRRAFLIAEDLARELEAWQDKGVFL